jgi:hypothetical protein
MKFILIGELMAAGLQWVVLALLGESVSMRLAIANLAVVAGTLAAWVLWHALAMALEAIKARRTSPDGQY